jgi:hypothetical protein
VASTAGTTLGPPACRASMAVRRAIKPPPLGQNIGGSSMPQLGHTDGAGLKIGMRRRQLLETTAARWRGGCSRRDRRWLRTSPARRYYDRGALFVVCSWMGLFVWPGRRRAGGFSQKSTSNFVLRGRASLQYLRRPLISRWTSRVGFVHLCTRYGPNQDPLTSVCEVS